MMKKEYKDQKLWKVVLAISLFFLALTPSSGSNIKSKYFVSKDFLYAYPTQTELFGKQSFTSTPKEKLPRFAPHSYWIVQSGVSYAQVRGGNESLKPIFSFQSGGHWIHRLEPNVGFRTGIQLHQKGYRVDYESIDETRTKYRNNLYYISAPALFHIYVGNRVQWFIDMGPELHLFLQGTQKGESKQGEEIITIDQTISSGIRTFDISMYLGSGFIIPLQERKRGLSYSLLVETVYSRGFIAIHEPTGSAVEINIRNSAWQLNLGLVFKI